MRAATNELLGRLRAIPGVSSAATDRMEFVRGFGRDEQTIRAEGVASLPEGASPRFYHVVSPEYFDTVRLPVLAGRSFDASDRTGSLAVVIINQHLAQTLWPDGSAVGRRIKLGPADSLPWLTIVGLTRDVTSRGRVRNYTYVPSAQATSRGAERHNVRARSVYESPWARPPRRHHDDRPTGRRRGDGRHRRGARRSRVDAAASSVALVRCKPDRSAGILRRFRVPRGGCDSGDLDPSPSRRAHQPSRGAPRRVTDATTGR